MEERKVGRKEGKKKSKRDKQRPLVTCQDVQKKKRMIGNLIGRSNLVTIIRPREIPREAAAAAAAAGTDFSLNKFH